MSELKCFYRDWAALVKKQPDAAAILLESGLDSVTYTYEQVDQLICRYLAFFEEQGLIKGDIVMTMLPNSVEVFVLFLAAIRGGYGYAPMPCNASDQEIGRLCNLLKPKLCFIKEGLICDTFEKNFSSIVRIDIVCDGKFEWLTHKCANRNNINAKIYLSTSGSTGEAKAIVIDGDVLWSSGYAFSRELGITEKNIRFWNYLPMFYLGGLFNMGLIPLCCGGSLLITESFSGKTLIGFFSILKRFDITALWMAPMIAKSLLQLSQLLTKDYTKTVMENIAVCLVGMAPIELDTKKRFEEVFGVQLLENYALSETTFLTTEKPSNLAFREESSVGTALSYAGFKFEQSLDFNGQQSEIKVKTSYLFDGYLSESGQVNIPLDDEGYFLTGDMGYMDENSQLVITGRKRDIIKKGGHMVVLKEIEILASKHENVQESAAVSLPHDYYGEAYTLYVVTDVKTQEIQESITSFLHQNLVRYKWPEDIKLIDSFPKTSSGKIKKQLLKG